MRSIETERLLKQLRHPNLTLRPSLLRNQSLIIPKIRFAPGRLDVLSPPNTTVIPLPINNLGEPVRLGDFKIWPELVGEQAFFTLETPRLEDFTMTVLKGAHNGTIEITGGNAVFVLSVYAEEDLATIEQYRDSWSNALKDAGNGTRNWKYTPLHLKNLQAIVKLPQEHIKNEPEIIVNSSNGTVIFMVELSELGAQIWQQALNAKQGNTIPGAFELTASYYAQLQSQLVSREQLLSSTIGNFVKDLGSESYKIMNSQYTGEAKVIVSGHQTIEKVVIELNPEGGQPISQVIGPEGGQLSAIVTAADLNQVDINWNAKVSYRSSGWPIVRDSGKLSFAAHDTTAIVKPELWVIGYLISCMLLDENGNVLPNSLTSDLENRVQCDFAYSAPFIEGGSALHSTFETSSQYITNVTFPKPAGQPPGSLKLTLFAKRKANDKLLTRMLQPDESWILVKVDPNAKISIMTNKDPVNENSWESEIFNLFANMS